MTPQEALEAWENYGGHVAMPQIYRDMGLERLRILVAESAKPKPIAPMDRIATPRLNYNPLDRLLGRETPPGPAPAPAPTDGPLEKALRNPKRLRTPGRQRASFLYHLKVCGSVEQAAARTGVNRGSLYRWRRQDAPFAERWDEAIALRAREVGDDIVLQAAQVQVDPLFYEGKQVGERRRINTRLLMHVQRRMDGERHRAEDRAARRERTVDETALAERIVALVSERLKMSRPASPVATPDADTSSNETKDMKDAA
jgi:hypothetical protein